ncbi:GNAT family N-acetyltransferase [Lentzea sp. NPDC042327]|uniref:GNAT family N-acetyltransferase n=1 Tax=Lentzea sp. NPDC042327 TaxID=3154801 RepID=UPI0033DB7EF6
MERLRTERLTLRPLTESDVDDLRRLHADPDVMRFLDPAPVGHYLAGGFHAAVERRTGRWLGWFELGDTGAGVFELGYRLRRDCWGRGYATEGAGALVEHAFRARGAQRVVATTMAVNAGSRRVMRKCGLRYVRTVFPQWDEPLPGAEHGDVEYELTRQEWESA